MACLCVDFKAINAVTASSLVLHAQGGGGLGKCRKELCRIQTRLNQGILLSPDDVPKTAFVCHKGEYEFLRMPFKVRNAPAVFQELMQGVFKDCSSICLSYMDDLVIFSSSLADRVTHVRTMLGKLKKAGLMANPAKCHWSGTRMEFLGLLVVEGTMTVPQHRVEALANFTRPT